MLRIIIYCILCVTAGVFFGHTIAKQQYTIKTQIALRNQAIQNQIINDKLSDDFYKKKQQINNKIKELVSENHKIKDDLNSCYISNQRLQLIRNAVSDANSITLHAGDRESTNNLTGADIVDYNLKLIEYGNNCKLKLSQWVAWYNLNR